MNKKITIWQKIKEFFQTKEEIEKFKKMLKLAHESNSKKTRKENFYLLLNWFITTIAIILAILIIKENYIINQDNIMKLGVINHLFLLFSFSISIACIYVLPLIIYLINLEEIINKKPETKKLWKQLTSKISPLKN